MLDKKVCQRKNGRFMNGWKVIYRHWPDCQGQRALIFSGSAAARCQCADWPNKNNIPIRICGRFADKSASEIVLNSTAAINLPDIKGRFLYLQGNELIEFQAYYFDDETMLDESVEVSPGNMLTESYTVNHHEEEIKVPSKSKSVTEEIKQVNYEEYDFNFGEDEEIEWSVDK